MNTVEIGAYLIQRLYEYGVKHIFGDNSDYLLKFNKLLGENSLVDFINTCHEQGADFPQMLTHA